MEITFPISLAISKTEKQEIKRKRNTYRLCLGDLGPVWYVCLKTENCCLKTFVEIRVGEKVY